MFYLNVRLISPTGHRKDLLSSASARLITNFGNANVRVYLIVDTCLVKNINKIGVDSENEPSRIQRVNVLINKAVVLRNLAV